MVRAKSENADPNPAPGDLEILQAFLNTAAIRKKRDQIAGPRELSRWFAQRKLSDGEGTLSVAEHRKAVTAREAIRALIAVNNGYRFDPAAVEALDEAVASSRFRLSFDTDGAPRFEPTSTGVDAALGRLLAIVTAAWNSGEWLHFKACGDPTCGAAFFSTNARSRWCTRRCGDRMRARHFRRGDKYRGRSKRKSVTFLGQTFRI